MGTQLGLGTYLHGGRRRGGRLVVGAEGVVSLRLARCVLRIRSTVRKVLAGEMAGEANETFGGREPGRRGGMPNGKRHATPRVESK